MGNLPLDCDHELRLELYVDRRRLSVSKSHRDVLGHAVVPTEVKRAKSRLFPFG